jgi:hypothetical protein
MTEKKPKKKEVEKKSAGRKASITAPAEEPVKCPTGEDIFKESCCRAFDGSPGYL